MGGSLDDARGVEMREYINLDTCLLLVLQIEIKEVSRSFRELVNSVKIETTQYASPRGRVNQAAHISEEKTSASGF